MLEDGLRIKSLVFVERHLIFKVEVIFVVNIFGSGVVIPDLCVHLTSGFVLRKQLKLMSNFLWRKNFDFWLPLLVFRIALLHMVRVFRLAVLVENLLQRSVISLRISQKLFLEILYRENSIFLNVFQQLNVALWIFQERKYFLLSQMTIVFGTRINYPLFSCARLAVLRIHFRRVGLHFVVLLLTVLSTRIFLTVSEIFEKLRIFLCQIDNARRHNFFLGRFPNVCKRNLNEH